MPSREHLSPQTRARIAAALKARERRPDAYVDATSAAVLHSPDWEPDVVQDALKVYHRLPPRNRWNARCACGWAGSGVDTPLGARSAFLAHKYSLDPLLYPRIATERAAGAGIRKAVRFVRSPSGFTLGAVMFCIFIPMATAGIAPVVTGVLALIGFLLAGLSTLH